MAKEIPDARKDRRIGGFKAGSQLLTAVSCAQIWLTIKKNHLTQICVVALTMISGKCGSVFFLLFLHGEKKTHRFPNKAWPRPGSVNRQAPVLGNICIDLLKVLIRCTAFPW